MKKMLLILLLFIFPLFAVEVNILDSLCVQRTDGSSLFDIYFLVTELEEPISISIFARTNDNQAVELLSFVDSKDTFVTSNGIKHLVSDISKDIKIDEYEGYLEFFVQFSNPSNNSCKCKNCIYIANSRSDNLVRIDNIFGQNYTNLNSIIFGGLYTAHDVTTDTQGRIYISDSDNMRIVRVDNMSGYGAESLCRNQDSTEVLSRTSGITFDQDGRLYIVDYINCKIIRVDDIEGNGWISYGGIGSGIGEFDRPFGVAIDSHSRIYITDSHNCRVVRIDNMYGDNWTVLGKKGVGLHEFDRPTGIDIDNADRIYVSDRKNYRIVRMEDIEGTGWETCYPGIRECYAIAVDEYYNTYSTDFLDHRIVRVSNMDPSTVIYFSTGLNRPYGVHISKY